MILDPFSLSVTTLTNPERLFEAIPALRVYVPIRLATYPVRPQEVPLGYALHLSCSPVSQSLPLHRSARGATLGNGGWLTLTMPGLSPDQMRTASRRANARITGDNGAEPIVVKCAKRTTIGGA